MSREIVILLCKWMDVAVDIVVVAAILLALCGLGLAVVLLLVPRLAHVRITPLRFLEASTGPGPRSGASALERTCDAPAQNTTPQSPVADPTRSLQPWPQAPRTISP
jgi:hypothetical protein